MFLCSASAQENKILEKKELSTIYNKAIADFITVNYKKDSVKFDTLFFINRQNHKEDNFPEVILLKEIDGVKIILFSDSAANSENKKLCKQRTPIINLFGFVSAVNAEFIFISFYPNFNFAQDCKLKYKIKKSNSELNFESSEIKDLMYDKSGKPSYYKFYKNGKFVKKENFVEK